MGEIIKVKNSSYERYEKLLLRRDSLRKEAAQINMNYIRKFGSLILAVFQKKMECIRKKKTIFFYQAARNRGEAMDPEALNVFLEKEMAEYQERLKGLLDENMWAQNMKMISEREILEIKKIYRKLTKQLHPDINPMTAESEELFALWNRIVLAYTCNSLKDLKELEVLAKKALEQMGTETLEIEIPDIEEKMKELEAEIRDIMATDPYQYKFILESPELIEEKKKNLQEELEQFAAYEAELDQILEQMMMDGGTMIWRMN